MSLGPPGFGSAACMVMVIGLMLIAIMGTPTTANAIQKDIMIAMATNSTVTTDQANFTAGSAALAPQIQPAPAPVESPLQIIVSLATTTATSAAVDREVRYVFIGDRAVVAGNGNANEIYPLQATRPAFAPIEVSADTAAPDFAVINTLTAMALIEVPNAIPTATGPPTDVSSFASG